MANYRNKFKTWYDTWILVIHWRDKNKHIWKNLQIANTMQIYIHALYMIILSAIVILFPLG